MSTDSTLVFDVAGMDCADCARTVERVVAATPGVSSAQVNFSVGTLTVNANGNAHEDLPRSISHNVDKAGYQAMLRDNGVRANIQSTPWYLNRSVLHSAAALVLWLIAFSLDHTTDLRSTAIGIYLAAIAIGGYPIARAAMQSVRVRRIDMNLLMTISVIGAAAIGEWSEGGLVVVLFSLGTALQALAFDRTRNSIRSLFELAPEEATLLEGDQESRVTAASLRVDNIVRIRPGERVPTDGEIIRGISAFNESAITGESMPVEKSEGSTVYAGALNGSGVIDMRVTTLPQNSTIATIIRLVEEASASKAPSQQMVDRFAAIYTPAVVILAGVIALGGWMYGDGGEWFYRALVLLVIACPCALVISTPVSIVSAIGNATRLGMLVKGGAALEEAGRVTTIAFDKTGTLTSGRPAVTGVTTTEGISEIDLIGLAAAVEQGSEHPLARAIVARATQLDLDLPTTSDFEAVTSAGALATIDGRRVGVGNTRLLEQMGVVVDGIDQVDGTAIYVAEGHRLLGAIQIADRERANAHQVLDQLRAIGLGKLVMLTGDQPAVAQHVAAQVGISDVHAALLPQQKSEAIIAMQQTGERVMVIGDGINDAPALALANVGVAMGMGGSDIALDSADMALMRDDLAVLPRVIDLSRKTVEIIRQNITLSLVTKLAALLLGVFGFVSLWIAVIVDVGTSVIVTLNGMRLARYQALSANEIVHDHNNEHEHTR
ncbi:MAG: cadmium-translocating P-type ATPase [Thermomicrobiales bacterium]|nr:cadmium-translocating P-type ATPase [Thermomicrobiales bacterium]